LSLLSVVVKTASATSAALYPLSAHSIRSSERSPILDAIGCALLRVIGREGIELSRFEDEEELLPVNSAGGDVDDDDAVMVGPMIDKTFFSQLASNPRTITETNWVCCLLPRRIHLSVFTVHAGALHRQVLFAH
jgi:hypothetical protein